MLFPSEKTNTLRLVHFIRSTNVSGTLRSVLSSNKLKQAKIDLIRENLKGIIGEN